MVSVFSPFTKRPAAHFREVLAAVRLLTVGDQEAAEVVSVLCVFFVRVMCVCKKYVH